MKGFNLSEWAINHSALVLFMIIILGVAGAYSYVNLGRAEDPSFTIKTMVVSRRPGPAPRRARCRPRSPTRSKRSCRNCPISTASKTYSQPGVHFDPGHFPDPTPPKGSAVSVVPGPQEGRSTSGRPAGRGLSDRPSMTSMATSTRRCTC